MINDAGQIGFYSTLRGTSGGFSDNFGIYRADANNQLEKIVRGAEGAPDGNGQFGTVRRPIMNSQGTIAFSGAMVERSAGSTTATEYLPVPAVLCRKLRALENLRRTVAYLDAIWIVRLSTTWATLCFIRLSLILPDSCLESSFRVAAQQHKLSIGTSKFQE
ncbi:MAG: hypothetical protein R3C03_19330 [Pirellulaceae bacterium]